MIASTRSTSGWTGGQYSLLRIIFASAAFFYAALVWLGGEDGSVAQRWTATALIGSIAIPFALGVLDRLAALALALALLLHRFILPAPELLTSWPAFESLLILHVFVPKAPYASWAARGRSDPRGDWRLPDALHDVAWLVLGLTHLLSGLAAMSAMSASSDGGLLEYLSIGLHLAFLPLGLFSRTRKLALCIGVLSLAFEAFEPGLILALVAHLSCVSPAWIAGCSGEGEILFYDADCGLCHRAVRFCIAEDHAGRLWSFAPLDGSVFEARIPADKRSALPDSVIVLTQRGDILSQSAALVHCLARFGGLWRVVSWLIVIVPPPLRDAIYAGVAKVRYRLFKAPDSACPLVPQTLRSRFLLDTDAP